ncbi:hypothetical protein ARAM_001314 [Aspergillus rambellii]|uniref:RTA1 domain protein n=1 Tax=Aspergillus rambellii TaxID=308745 RepID=A0A0F8X1L3_9EURO|nr:hypothetical protein ARAM_001314 [Aspergillus rambellii]
MSDSTPIPNCQAYDPSIANEYGYRPSLAAGIVFCALFGVSMILHTVQATFQRTWWCYVFSVGCLAPTFFTAGTYVILGQFIQFIGPESSFLTPNLYLWVFCTCDIISLVVQAIGGGMAATALSANSDTTPGTDIMVAGVVFQMAAITVFLACAVDFMHRVMRRRLAYLITREMRVLLAATAFSITCVYVRSIYRTIELVQGWTGYLITHERYFIALDGAMMAAAFN